LYAKAHQETILLSKPEACLSIMAQLPELLEHRQDILRRHIILDIVDRPEDKTAARLFS